MKKVIYLGLLFFLISLTINCGDKNTEYDFKFEKPGVFICNEGNFTFSNSTLSFLDIQNDTIINDFFIKKNEFPLGDIAYSMTFVNDNIFLVVNNSGKIIVFDSKTGEYQATIKDLGSPRFILLIDSTKAYVSDLYGKTITIIDPSTYKIKGFVDTKCNTERMIKIGNYVYVVNWNYGNKLLKIDASQDIVVDSIRVTYQPNSLQKDKNGNLWVLSDGGMEPDTLKNEIPTLTCINPNDMSIIKIFRIGNRATAPTHLNINSTLDTLYFINSSWNGTVSSGGVYRFCVDDNIITNEPLIPEGNMQFYALGISEKFIFVSDAKDFVQEGDVIVYNKNGEYLKKFQAGINPSFFLFYE